MSHAVKMSKEHPIINISQQNQSQNSNEFVVYTNQSNLHGGDNSDMYEQSKTMAAVPLFGMKQP